MASSFLSIEIFRAAKHGAVYYNGRMAEIHEKRRGQRGTIWEGALSLN